MPYISGTVRDDSGAPIARALRFYRRDTGGMLGTADSSGAAIPGDPHYDSVSLLLYCGGANGSTTVTDSSPLPKIVTVSGDAHISAVKSRFGETSLLLDGAGDSLFLSSDVPGLKLHNTDFTIEAFINLDTNGTASNQVILGKAASGQQSFYWGLNDLRTALVFWYSLNGAGSGTVAVAANFAFQPNTWYHVAVSRSGTSMRLFVDGAQVGATATVPATWYDTSQVACVGQISIGGYEYWFRGHIGGLRVTKGVGRYAANFTPPAVAFPNTVLTTPARALGEYYFHTDYTGEVTVVCLDDSVGALENDLILRAYAV